MRYAMHDMLIEQPCHSDAWGRALRLPDRTAHKIRMQNGQTTLSFRCACEESVQLLGMECKVWDIRSELRCTITNHM